MKRSEMVKLMVEEADSEFVLTLEQIANRMLSACEENGMIPPRAYLKALNMYDNGWEDEDEQS
jgi:hypothetical protein